MRRPVIEPTHEELLRVYAQPKTIGVVGASATAGRPAHDIPRYLQSQGYRIIPVNPRGGEILGERAFALTLLMTATWRPRRGFDEFAHELLRNRIRAKPTHRPHRGHDLEDRSVRTATVWPWRTAEGTDTSGEQPAIR